MPTRDETFLSPTTTFVGAIVLTTMLGVVDWASGYELQFFVFYFIPVAIASWTCGAKHGYFMGILSGGVWFLADFVSGHPYTHPSFAVWNTTVRLIAFLVLAFTTARIRALLRHERSISDELEKTLSEVKTLTGLLPICAGCKKIRNDSGYWQQIEEYIEKHSNAQFTHGLCHECMRKTLREAGLPDDVNEQTAGDDSSNRADAGPGTPQQ